jgi:xylan 1,4-beta-xylosidase
LRRFLSLLAAACVVTAFIAYSQQVMAPTHVPPGAPLPRYVYNVVAADFAAPVGHPLVKTRFNLFLGAQSDALGVKLVPLMADLKVDNYRASVRWGGRGRGGAGAAPGVVSGTPDKLVYNFQAQDEFVKLFKDHDIELLMTYSGTPDPLQEPASQAGTGADRFARTGGRSAPPKDLNKWKEIVRTVAKHYKDVGMPFQVHEVWNEPDGTYQFFNGTEAEYQQVYKATVEAVREADPDAIVAGPSADHHMLWNMSFVDFVYKNKLPLDHYAFHEYGSGDIALRQIDRANSSLNRYRYFDTTALSLDEYHDGECCEWCHDDVRNRYEGASEMLHDFTLLLSRPELFSLSWAWWRDTPSEGAGCMGVVTVDGRRKAVYNAWKAYAMMPVDRRAVTTEGAVEGIASSDAHKASLLMWNRSSYDRRVDVHLKNLPFKKGTVKLYRIDKTHASVVDGAYEDLQVNETYPVTEGNWSYLDAWIPKYGTMYVEVDDGTGISEQTPVKVGTLIRLNRYYPARGKTKSYADFDRRTWTARLGMMDEKTADERVGVLAKELPDVLDVAVKVDGKPVKVNANSLLGMRVDYRVGRQYAKSVLFHGGLYDQARKDANPWSLKAPLDDTVAVPDLAKFQIPLKKLAPAGWNGEVHISFLMQNSGPGTQAKFTLRPGK